MLAQRELSLGRLQFCAANQEPLTSAKAPSPAGPVPSSPQTRPGDLSQGHLGVGGQDPTRGRRCALLLGTLTSPSMALSASRAAGRTRPCLQGACGPAGAVRRLAQDMRQKRTRNPGPAEAGWGGAGAAGREGFRGAWHWEAWGRHAVLSHGPAETQWGGSRGLGRQGKEGSRARLHTACPQGAWRSRVGPGVCSGARVPSTAPRAPSWSQRSARLRVPRSTPVPIHPRAEERRR